MSTICPNCSTQAPPGAAFCDNCGTSLSAAPAAPIQPPAAPIGGGSNCPNCNANVLPGEAFCGECGASVSAAIPAAVPPVAPPAAPYQPPPQQAPPVQAGNVCPSCGAQVIPGSQFCDNCGSVLAAPVETPPIVPPVVVPAITPRLVIQATNTTLNFPQGKSEVLIGREDPVSAHFPDIDLGPHGGDEGGVSRKHALLTVQGEHCSIEDLQAVNYTYVNRQKINPGVKQPLNNGDELRFGKVVVTFYTQ